MNIIDSIKYDSILRKWLAERDAHTKTISNIINTADLTHPGTHKLLAIEVRALRELLGRKTIKQSSLDMFNILLKLRENMIDVAITNALNRKFPHSVPNDFKLDVDYCFEKNTVYAIIPAYDFAEPMDMIMYVSQDERETYNILHTLNNIKDEEILNEIQNWVQDEIQGTEQHYSSSQQFRIIELDKNNLERYYKYLNNNTPLKCKVIYDSICIQGILNM